MSEEKLYAVRNDEGLLLSYSEQGAPLWRVWGEMLADKPTAEITARAENGHVVTLIEEPEKVVLTKEQAEIVEGANYSHYPATYISNHTKGCNGKESLLMEAYVNGWKVKRPQLWYVKTPDNWMGNGKQGWLYKITGVINTISEDHRECTPGEQFTAEEIKQYHLDGFEKEEVTDDEQ